MLLPLLLITLVAFKTAISISENLHPLSDEYIAKINEKAITWKAGKNFVVDQLSKAKLQASGVIFKPKNELDDDMFIIDPHNETEAVPDKFDAREQWPNCESLREIRDQGNCGACWAFGAVTAMSDRICIHSNQTKQTRVSAENLNDCCSACNFMCSGGDPSWTWIYWQKTGIVTGGKYQASQGCQDYTLTPCSHRIKSPTYPMCPAQYQFVTPDCQDVCFSNSSLNYQKELTYGLNATAFTNAKQYQLEIMKNGPIETMFEVYDDFFSYKSGVYQPTSTNFIGNHAVRILGWSTENDTDYWIVANSWNEEWGDRGMFKIVRGVNSCGFEKRAWASLPKMD